ncbi:conserved hypothetical protein (plasmid) [Borreliella afzelii PKo]|uniref:Uncharacterized protein n=1 Tax=Borreliella afzelii (strain PKo) TaxID=390236 RepID=Q0SLE0_BORAP|nr:hypothetical protein BAPKO_3546 [Borreliella afzelii PKo]AEL70570.1 conserved hypothetical protein [Borreliella afzelii PKo]AJY73089.1 hypothetical protein BAFK78_AC010 [Borreliella afzelii K78]
MRNSSYTFFNTCLIEIEYLAQFDEENFELKIFSEDFFKFFKHFF